jgi:hypothetical protein
MDTALGGFLMFEQIDGNMSQDSEVFRRLIFADPAVIFVQSDIQNPMQLIFDRPMSADNVQNAFGIAG